MRVVAPLSVTRLAAVCAVLLALAGCGRETAAPPALPANAPDPLVQGQDEWLFINYWAEWCKPCLEEIPELNAFAREHAARELDVSGYARNLTDGRVEVLACGRIEAVEQLLARLHEGPRWSQVGTVVVEDAECCAEGFRTG